MSAVQAIAIEAAQVQVPVSNNAISVEGLCSHYGDRQVLYDIDFDVRQNEIMVVMGGSGSGKSTLLRHLIGLERPTAGSVCLLGQDINRIGRDALHDLRRTVGVAFQSGALFSSLSVLENIILPLEEHTDLDRQTMEIMARMKLEVVDLAGFGDFRPSELSGGMLKRAAVARAIVMDPKLLFFDEPSAGLDPAVASALDELILALRDAMGMSVVVVTHELDSAFKIADRITVLDGGRILAVDDVAGIRSSDNQRIRNLLNRIPDREEVDPNEYLKRLTGRQE